ncbi:peptide chain release factor N(5)-glutamine methyltransferase [Pseudomaricurvus alcaniphilus]|uniref:peptide chain release factor N(5)-glutamine methyltransferase n=1 Tax=Pseudomaricurvus alcaniphilus TaxID=1166482 RepID=UPI0024414DD4|nr:peptide chain release factor N(5)-glutamine methyltransferase [Pseudomaricurvus alcaniphilus]
MSTGSGGGPDQPGLSIKECLRLSTRLPQSPSARLDTELLLARVLGKARSYLYTWPEKILTQAQWQEFNRLLQQRALGHPVAHLLGAREFWGLELAVNEATLIPRPETELLVEAALQLDLPARARVLDLGTGTGAIALALASERPRWQVVAVDKQPAAAELAEVNRARLGLDNVRVLVSDWFAALPDAGFDLIVGNPPYIPANDPHLAEGDVRFEPRSALVAGANGLADIDTILRHSCQFLFSGGWLLLEHGYDQGEAVRQLFQQQGFTEVATRRDLAGHDRLTLGLWPGQGK